MHPINKLAQLLFIIICSYALLSLFSSKNFLSNDLSSSRVPTIIKPEKSNGSLNFYTINELQFHLPKNFFIESAPGPDFEVYYINYPAGVRATLAFANVPDVENIVSILVCPERKQPRVWKAFNGIEGFIGLPEKYDKLIKTGSYSEVYDLKEYSWDRDSSIFIDEYLIEAEAKDSMFIWYNHPNNENFGRVDMILDDNSPQSYFPHLLAKTNKYLTWKEFKKFGEQLKTSFYKDSRE